MSYYLSNKDAVCDNWYDARYNLDAADIAVFTSECAAAAADAGCKKSKVDLQYKSNGSQYCENLLFSVNIYYQEAKCRMSDCKPCPK